MLNRFSAAKTAKHLVLILGAVVVLLPFYVMLTYSFKSPSEIMTNTGGFFGAQEFFRDDYCIKRGNAPEDCMVTPWIYTYTTAFSKAPLLAFAIFSVVAHWNDYFWPRIVITDNRDLFTPPLGLREFKGDADGDNFGPMMATAVVIVTPLIVAFMLAQRRFIEGITLSGMK